MVYLKSNKEKKVKKKVSRNEVENDEHDVLCGVFGNKYSAKRAWWENEQEKRNLFFVYIKFDVGIETGKDKENNLIEVISQGINFIILDKISPLYNVIYKGSSVVMLLL